MANFHIEKRLGSAPDILRNYNWEIHIPVLPAGITAIATDEDLILRARSVNLPGRTQTPIESYFRGMKQKFAGRADFTGVCSIQFEEMEDQIVYQTMYQWQNLMLDIDPSSPTGGIAKVSKKREVAKDLIIKMFTFDGKLAPVQVRLINAYPESIDEQNLDMTGNDSLKINVNFSMDFFLLEKSPAI